MSIIYMIKKFYKKEIIHETESKVLQTVQENKINKKSKILSDWQNINFKKQLNLQITN